MKVDIRQSSPAGSLEVSAGADDDVMSSLGVQPVGGTVNRTITFDVHQLVGGNFSFVTTLYSTAGQTPVVSEIQTRVFPSPNRGFVFSAPLILSEDNDRHPLDDWQALTALASYNRTASYQELGQSWDVNVEDYSWMRSHRTSDSTWWNGTLTLRLKVYAA